MRQSHTPLAAVPATCFRVSQGRRSLWLGATKVTPLAVSPMGSLAAKRTVTESRPSSSPPWATPPRG